MRSVRPDLRVYPAVLAALAVGSGVVLAERWGGTPVAWGCTSGGLALLALLPRPRRRLVSLARLGQTLLLAAACVALGGAVMAAHQTVSPRDISRLLPPGREADVTLDAVVVGLPVVRPSGTRLRVDVSRVVLPSGPVAASGRVEVTLAQPYGRPPEAYGAFRPGDRLRLTGTLRPPPAHRNPADFDRGRWLRRQRVTATLRAVQAADVRFLGHHLGPLDALVERVRARTEAAFARFVPTEAGRSFQTALVLGDRRGLDDDVRDAFARTGLMHLIAVSGLHVLLVGLLLYRLLKGLLLRLGAPLRTVDAVRAGVTLGVLVVYALLTGGSASVVRAVVMTALVVGGDVLQRPSPPLNALGVAALVLLLFDPMQVFDVGFGLSFAAVAGLVVLTPVLTQAVPARWRERRAVRAFTSAVMTTLGATLATLPLLLYSFGRLPIGGLALNLIAIPLTNAAFSAGLLTALFGGWPGLAAPFGAMADVLARAVVAFTEAGDAGLGGLAYEGYVTRGLVLAALTAGLLSLAAWEWPRGRVRLALLGLAFGVAALWQGVLRGEARPHLELVFFDVGQGDALLVRTPSGRTLLVDAGSSESDAARRTILPHLRRYGLSHLDAVVVTHPHDDHEGGVAALLRAGRVRGLYRNADTLRSPSRRRTQRLADSLRVPVRVLTAGDTLALDPDVRIAVLAPARGFPAQSTNDGSLVLQLTYGATRVLLLGDAETPSETALVARYGALLQSDVIKVGHHGSRTSSSGPLLRAARAPGCTAVVSVAARNVYRLPGPEVVQRWRRTCRRTHLTSANGALWLRSDGRTVTKQTWR